MIYRYPVNYIAITQYYKKGNHYGLDLGWNSAHGGKNQPIYASESGTIEKVVDNDKTGKSWGNLVKINHGNKNYTLYAHLKNGVLVKKGQQVEKGQIIGYMGTTGHSTGNHCHYEVYEGGSSTSKRVNPISRTYVYEGQTVGSTTAKSKEILYYKEQYNLTRLLKKGLKGNDVKELQKKLSGIGYSIGRYGVDGSFGNDTLKAVKLFQKNNKLKVDGIVGKDTAHELGWNYKGK